MLSHIPSDSGPEIVLSSPPVENNVIDIMENFEHQSPDSIDIVSIDGNNSIESMRNQTRKSGNRNSNMKRNEFYLSKFDINITCESMMEYMEKTGINDLTNTRVIPLISKNKDINSLTFITFKIDTDDHTAEIINKRDFWPKHCSITPFIHQKPSVCSLIRGEKTSVLVNGDLQRDFL